MNLKKFLQRATMLLLIVAGIFTTANVGAAVQIFEGVGEHFMTDNETINFAKHQAELAAERDALEQVKVYVKSQSKLANGKLDDEIIAIAAGILRVKGTKFFLEDIGDGLRVKAFVTAEIDVDELETLLEREIKNFRE